MVTQSIFTSIAFADGSELLMVVKAKTANYFGIKDITPKAVMVQRKSYSYYRTDGLSNESKSVVTVPSSRYPRIPRLNVKNVREVRVPTELFTPRGNVKTHGIKFPVKVDYIDIGRWLYRNCTLHKPKYFLTEAGKKRVVFDWTNEGG
jgi:hypothetical protein